VVVLPVFGFYELQPDGTYKYVEIEAPTYEEACRIARERENRNLAEYYKSIGSPTVSFGVDSIVAPGVVLDYQGNVKYGELNPQNSKYIVIAVEGIKQMLQTTPEPEKYVPSPPQTQPTSQDVQTFTQKVESVASVVQAVQALLQQTTPQPQPEQAQQANVKPTQPPTPSTPKSTLVTFPTPTQIVEAGVGAGIVLLLLLLLFMK
jgi:hypothetical protein